MVKITNKKPLRKENKKNPLEGKLVTKHNLFINAKYNFDYLQSRFLLIVAALYSEEELRKGQVNIPLTLIYNTAHLSGPQYDRIKKSLGDLMTKVIEIKNSNGSWDKYNLIPHTSGSDIGRTIKTKIEPDLIPYIKNFEEVGRIEFTKYLADNVNNFKNKYSFRVYDFCKQMQNTKHKTRTLSAELFCDSLGLTGTNRIKPRLFTQVLDPAMEEINSESDIIIELEYWGRGKDTTLKFSFKLNPKFKSGWIDAEVVDDQDFEDSWSGWMTRTEYERILREYDLNYVKYAVQIANLVKAEKIVTTRYVYFRGLLRKEEFKKEYSLKFDQEENIKKRYNSDYKKGIKVALELFSGFSKEEFLKDVLEKGAGSYSSEAYLYAHDTKSLDITNEFPEMFNKYLIEAYFPDLVSFSTWMAIKKNKGRGGKKHFIDEKLEFNRARRILGGKLIENNGESKIDKFAKNVMKKGVPYYPRELWELVNKGRVKKIVESFSSDYVDFLIRELSPKYASYEAFKSDQTTLKFK